MNYMKEKPDLTIRKVVKLDPKTRVIHCYVFIDGIKVFFFDNDRKNHIIESPGETVGFPLPEGSSVSFVGKQMKVTYPYWRKRWGS